jgi:hypothetical protein
VPIRANHGLRDDEAEKLAGILGCPRNQLDNTLSAYASASLQEYIGMILGQKVFTRGADIREYRLFLLIQHAFGNQLPDEQKICDLFQTTVSQSRALIRSVMSKYQYDLSAAIRTTITNTIVAAVQVEEGGDYEFTVNSENVVDAMNRALASIDGTLPQVIKKKGTVTSYVLKPSSRDELIDHYEVNQ